VHHPLPILLPMTGRPATIFELQPTTTTNPGHFYNHQQQHQQQKVTSSSPMMAGGGFDRLVLNLSSLQLANKNHASSQHQNLRRTGSGSSTSGCYSQSSPTGSSISSSEKVSLGFFGVFLRNLWYLTKLTLKTNVTCRG